VPTHDDTFSQQRRRIDVLTEFGCGKTKELVGLGIAAGPEVHGQVVFSHRGRVGLSDDRRGVLNFEVADRHLKLMYPVAVHAADLAWHDGLSVQYERQ
jgi:hypothetical protein